MRGVGLAVEEGGEGGEEGGDGGFVGNGDAEGGMAGFGIFSDEGVDKGLSGFGGAEHVGDLAECRQSAGYCVSHFVGSVRPLIWLSVWPSSCGIAWNRRIC